MSNILCPLPELSLIWKIAEGKAEAPEEESPAVLLSRELELVSRQMYTAATLSANGCDYYFSEAVQHNSILQRQIILYIKQRDYAVVLNTKTEHAFITISWS